MYKSNEIIIVVVAPVYITESLNEVKVIWKTMAGENIPNHN